jgi:outer membrane autotransporter protein
MSPASFDILTSATIDLNSQYTQSLIKRMHSLRSFIESLDRDMNYSQTKEYGWWTEAFGQWATQDSHSDSTGYEADTKGIAFGLDNLLSDKIIVGISVGTSKADIDLKQNQGDGDIRSYFGSAYASYFTDRMYFDGVLSFGLQDYDNTRRTNIGAISNNVSSSHDGESYAAYIESGCMLKAGDWAFQPFMALGYTYLDEESYDEHGANGINLSIESRKTDSLISDLGARIAYPFKAKTWLCIPEATLAWHHDYDIDSRSIVASFDSAPNIRFKASGEEYDKDGVILGAALTLISKNDLSLSINYTGDIRSSYYSHSLTGGIRYEF